MAFEIFQRASQAGWNGGTVTGRPQVARDANDSDNSAGLVAQGQFGGQTPARTTAGIPMQFQVLDDGPARASDRLILRSIEFSQFLGKDFTHMATQQLPLFLQTAAFDQRLIHDQIAPLRIFEEEGNFRDMIEQLLKDNQLGREIRRSFSQWNGKG